MDDAADRVEQLVARRRELEEQIRQGRGTTIEQLRWGLANRDYARRAAVTSAELAAVSAESAAEAEDRVAELHDRLADAGIGDLVAHRRAAVEHRQAGIYDRQVAAQERRDADRWAQWDPAEQPDRSDSRPVNGLAPAIASGVEGGRRGSGIGG